MNRIAANMPYHKLSSYLPYKAGWESIPVYRIKEVWTSKTCHKCGQIGERLAQGLFKCPSCNLAYNADLNAAINVAKRFSRYMQEEGGTLACLKTPMNHIAWGVPKKGVKKGRTPSLQAGQCQTHNNTASDLSRHFFSFILELLLFL